VKRSRSTLQMREMSARCTSARSAAEVETALGLPAPQNVVVGRAAA
jgi:hypothetical protein